MNGLVREGGAGDLMMVAISSIAVGSVVLAGVWLAGFVLLRRRPAARHLVLNAALLVYLLGPLWILAARALPDGARQVMQPAVRALAFLDAAEVPLAAPARGGAVATADRTAGGVSRGLDVRWLLGLWALGSALLLRPGRVRVGAGAPDAAGGDAAGGRARRLGAGHPHPRVSRTVVAARAHLAGGGLAARRGDAPAGHLVARGRAGAGPRAARAGAGARDGTRPPRGPAGRVAAPDRGGPALAQPAGAPLPAGPGAGPGGELRRPGPRRDATEPTTPARCWRWPPATGPRPVRGRSAWRWDRPSSSGASAACSTRRPPNGPDDRRQRPPG